MNIKTFLTYAALATVSIFCGVSTAMLLAPQIKQFSLRQPPRPSREELVKSHGSEFKQLQSELKVDKINELNYSSRRTILVLFGSTECRWCSESLPLYQRLSQSPAIQNGHMRFIVVFPETEDVITKYLKEGKVSSASAVSRRLGDFGVTGTPTLALVRDGRLVDGWSGYQSYPDLAIDAILRVDN